jgi:hypothetical protein
VLVGARTHTCCLELVRLRTYLSTKPFFASDPSMGWSHLVRVGSQSKSPYRDDLQQLDTASYFYRRQNSPSTLLVYAVVCSSLPCSTLARVATSEPAVGVRPPGRLVIFLTVVPSYLSIFLKFVYSFLWYFISFHTVSSLRPMLFSVCISSAKIKEWVELYLHSPNTPSWRGAELKHRDSFTFTLPYPYIALPPPLIGIYM